ncbi:MAG: hypothetical protein FJ276_28850 [Planctomycetes bacterium]|nr:hypothetical protein [Planctomycetota bacterium]
MSSGANQHPEQSDPWWVRGDCLPKVTGAHQTGRHAAVGLAVLISSHRDAVPRSISATARVATSIGWLLADPRLVEYESGKARFAPDSPAVKLGIKVIDVSGAGCVKE